MSDITIEFKVLTSKAGTNIKGLAKDARSLKLEIDNSTKSTERNTSQTKKNTNRQEDLGSRLRRLREVYTRIIESKGDLNEVDVRRARSIKREIDATENQIKTNRKAAGENVSRFARIKKSATSALGPAGLVGLSAVAGTAIVGMTRQAIRVGREYEQQLADLEAITGIAGERQEFLSDKALEASIRYGESATNIIEANKLVASQLAEKIDFGTDEGARQLAELSEQAIVLQKAAGIDLSSAVKAISATINQFNLPISESVRLINAFAAGSKEGAAEVGPQIESFKVAGATANGLNVSYQELIGSTQALAKNNIFGSEAGTVQRNMLLRLADGAKFAAEGIEDINIKEEGFAATLQRLQPIMNDTVALTRLFGAENVTGAQLLIKNADSVSEMTKKVSQGNVAYEQADVQLNTYNGAVARLTAVKNAQLIPAFQQSNGLIVTSINLLSDLIQEFGGGIGVINEWVAAFSRMNEARGALRNLVDTYTDFIIPLRIVKTLLEKTGIIESSEKYDKLFETIDAGSQTIKDQINFLSTHIEVLTKERKELEEGSETYQVYTEAIEGSITKLEASQAQFKTYIASLKEQRKTVKEGTFEYAEYTEKIAQAETALSLINGRLNDIRSSQEKQAQILADEGDAAVTLAAQKNELAESYKSNKERIDELIGKTSDLTREEWNELESLTAQNRAIKEQIEERTKLAEALSQRPSAPIEVPVDVLLPDEIDIPNIDLDIPFKKMKDIMEELNDEVANYQLTSALIGDGSDDIGFAIDRTKQAISELISNGYHPQSSEIKNLIEDLRSLEEQYQRVSEVDYLARFSGEQVAGVIQGIDSINRGLKKQVSEIQARAAIDKKAAKTAAERAQIEKAAQQQITAVQQKAKDERKAAIKETISATIAEAVIVQFSKVIKTIPFPFNIVAAPIAAAAIKVGMNKLVRLNTGGKVPGPASETRDTVPAILTPEEYVMNKISAKSAPRAMEAMNRDPKVAREVETFVKRKSLASGLAASALVNASRSDVSLNSLMGFNNGGFVGSKPTDSAVIGSVITREVQVLDSSPQYNEALLNAIQAQTAAIEKMKPLAEISYSEFHAGYKEFLEKESALGRE